MNDAPNGIGKNNPDTRTDDEELNAKSDEGGAQNESKGFDNLDSDPESETDESTVEPSAPELVSGDEKQVDTTIIDGYSQVDELERGNEPIMDQGKGSEDLSELPWWKRPFARLSEKKPEPEKGVDLTPSEKPPEKILDEELRVEEIMMVQQEVDTKLAAYKPKTSAGMGLWATVLGLILISAVGVAGILLPRQTNDENSGTLVEMAALYQDAGKPDDAIRVLDKAVEAGIADAETQGSVIEASE